MGETSPLTLLAAQLPAKESDRLRAIPGIEALLGDVYRRAREPWPTFDLLPELFFKALAQHLSGKEDIASRLESIRAADFYLATACAEADPRALAFFDSNLLAGVAQVVARIHSCDGDELEGTLRERLLVRRGDRPARIAEYSGRGSLRGWLQVAASRLALSDATRRKETWRSDETLRRMAPATADPTMAALKSRYRSEFNEAFVQAFRAAPARDRNLLRQHYLDGLSGDELAALYRVHRATAVRWLAAARQALFMATREAMAKKLSLPAGEFPSVLRLIRSELRLSLGSLS